MKTERDLQKEFERLDKTTMPIGSKIKIKQFISMERANNSRYDRLMNYAMPLRQIAFHLQDKFLYPSAEDLIDLINKFQQSKQGRSTNSDGSYSDGAIAIYKIAMKKFYQWLLGENPACIEWIQRVSIGRSKKKPPEILTEMQVKLLIDEATNYRDKALIAFLYDSGCRIGEALTIRRRDMIFDENGILVLVSGKTGVRRVRAAGESNALVIRWMSENPYIKDSRPSKEPSNDDALIFPVIQGPNAGSELHETNVRGLLQTACDRAKNRIRVYPHLFRHTRATLLVQNQISEMVLTKQMGWKNDSSMPSVYVHLNDKAQDEAVLKALRKEKNEKSD